MPSMFPESTGTVLTNQILSQAIVVAVGVAADGRREVLVFAIGDSDNKAFWTSPPPVAGNPRPSRNQAGHVRRPHGSGEDHRDRVAERRLATLPGALHAQCARDGREAIPGDGDCVVPARRIDAHRPKAGERRYFSTASMLELATMNNPIEVIDEVMILPDLTAA